MKKCKKCEEFKDLLDFSINRSLKDGYSSMCKSCDNEKNRNKRANLLKCKIESGEVRTKICNTCTLLKRISKFNRSKKTKDGYLDTCIECRKDVKNDIVYIETLSKICNKCNSIKPISNFYKCKKIKDGYFNHCIECEKSRSLEYHHTFKKNNIRKVRNFDRNLSKLKRRIRSAISNIMKSRGFRKKCKTEKILGCTIIELRVYIEERFESWMSWENHGLYNGEFDYGWDIDHIIPVSSAKDELELLKLNHYTNLQPLCSKVNRDIKKNKIYERKD